MADRRITGLSPGLLLAALALWGCPGSPSHMSTLPPEALPAPPPPGTPTERVTHNSGLVIEAGSNYDFTRELERIREDWETAQESSSVTDAMMKYLGSRDSRYISSQVTDIHRFILPRLSRKITQSPLGLEPWNGAYRLSFNVWSLDFLFETNPVVEWPHPKCWTEIGVSLYETAGDSLLFRQQPNLIITQRQPNLVRSVRNENPAGRSTLEPLYEKAAQEIFDAFERYWSFRPE